LHEVPPSVKNTAELLIAQFEIGGLAQGICPLSPCSQKLKTGFSPKLI